MRVRPRGGRAVIAAWLWPAGHLPSGDGLRWRTGAFDMPLATAQSLAWNLSRTLMTVIALIRTEHGYYALPASEFEGDAAMVVREYDPFER